MICRAIHHVTIAFVMLAPSPHAVAAAAVAITTDALDPGIAEETRLTPSSGERVTSVRAFTQRPEPQRPLSGNPLWAIPLTRLSATRDRPIFSATRRPPPPVLAAEPAPAPPPPPPQTKEAVPPPLSLVGTIASDEESFGIFLDQSTKRSLRLRLDDDYQGWKLRTIRSREATMEKDRDSIVLTLPAPAQGANDRANGQVPPTPANIDGSTPLAELKRR
ncbi:hypothetical protein JQ615_26815 [Bradyrhizobium jicamae]|uniref:General secretion pathway protein GspN n=1 Tax=Bradyrhizobium jicamae TaxID=280332 RepID=A0ABS5FQF9_9BRAD|nr:hypothetical protein [Bradyrhizobium jicamae]MBR0799003.1 hypothetical protein [Bradyrhizobium jicamae]